ASLTGSACRGGGRQKPYMGHMRSILIAPTMLLSIVALWNNLPCTHARVSQRMMRLLLVVNASSIALPLPDISPTIHYPQGGCPTGRRGTIQGHRLRLYWHRHETRANLGGGQGDAPAATVVERARGRCAQWAAERDGSGGRRTVSACAQRARGEPAVCWDPADQWLYRLCDPAQ